MGFTDPEQAIALLGKPRVIHQGSKDGAFNDWAVVYRHAELWFRSRDKRLFRVKAKPSAYRHTLRGPSVDLKPLFMQIGKLKAKVANVSVEQIISFPGALEATGHLGLTPSGFRVTQSSELYLSTEREDIRFSLSYRVGERELPQDDIEVDYYLYGVYVDDFRTDSVTPGVSI